MEPYIILIFFYLIYMGCISLRRVCQYLARELPGPARELNRAEQAFVIIRITSRAEPNQLVIVASRTEPS
jgi:hypothetical protein